MKNIICCKNKLLAFMIIIFMFCFSVFPVFADEVDLSEDMSYTIENEYLNFYFDEETAEFVVEDKETGKKWWSNPQNREDDNLAKGVRAEELNSQFKITYHTPGGKRRTYNSKADSLEYNQVDFEKINNGLRVDYTVGQEYEPEELIPSLISKESMEQDILANIEKEEDKEVILENFELISLKEQEDLDVLTLSDMDDDEEEEHKEIMKELWGDYRLVSPEIEELLEEVEEASDFQKEMKKSELLSERRSYFNTLLDTILNNINKSGIEDLEDLKKEDFDLFFDNEVYMAYDMGNMDEMDVAEILEEINYKIYDVNTEREKFNLEEVEKKLDIFNIVIEYILDGKELIVKVPREDISYTKDVVDPASENDEEVTYPLNNIELLPFFGAGHIDNQGYIFVPEGAGGLIDFTEDREESVDSYNKNIYGRDYAKKNREERILKEEQIHLPVFGIKNENSTLFGIIEEGAPIGNIRADKAGKRNSYNYIYADFNLIPRGKTRYKTGDTEFDIFQSRLTDTDIKVRYSFLTDDEADYSGMANRYRDYLKEKHNWQKQNSEDNLPFFLELVGGINAERPILGLPRDVVLPLTSFDQAGYIVEQLTESDIKNIHLRYSGWLTGGINHIYPENIEIESKLGGKEGFLELQKKIDNEIKNDVKLFPEVNFLHVMRNQLFDDFYAYKDSARLLDKLIAKNYDFDLATYIYKPESEKYVLSFGKLDNLIGSFLNDYETISKPGLTLSKMGNQINSDFRENETELIDRVQAMEISNKQMEKIFNNNIDTMISGANAYSLKYADTLVDIPTGNTEYNIITESVPFYQMVVSGYKKYAGVPLNFSPDYQKDFLKMMETGMLPYFKLFYNDPGLTMNTEFNYLYSGNYKSWISRAASLYSELNGGDFDILGNSITDHQQLKEGVAKTRYDNGLEVIVNYNNHSVQIDNRQIEAEDYLIIKEGD